MPINRAKKADCGKQKNFIIFFVIASFVFLAIFVILLFAQGFFEKKSTKAEDISYYKNFGAKIHADMQKVINESKESAPRESDVNFEDPEEVLTFNFYLSFMDDVLWIGEAEKRNYENLAATNSAEEAKELYRNEISYSLVMHYILIVNLVAEEQIPEMPDLNTQNKALEFAEALLKKPKRFEISKAFLDSFRDEYGLKTEEVNTKVNEIFSLYVKDLASRFLRSLNAENREKAYIEAVKIINIANP
ncbi:MAG: hypothetical protein N3F05_04265 [Candidatus Diapherotrites archaeon]|nr:hypothetical protein [Candidatus Diapherotrites archaeon]